MTLVYLLIAALGVVLGAVGLVRLVRTLSPERGDVGQQLPLTRLQKRAWLGLAIGLSMLVAMVIVVTTFGPTASFENRPVRLSLVGLLAAGLLAYVVGVWLTRPGAEEVEMDERDLEILRRAPAMQSAADLICIGVWSVVLTEIYWEQQVVPLAYLSLIFWSTLIVHMLALAVGILVGYGRSRIHA